MPQSPCVNSNNLRYWRWCGRVPQSLWGGGGDGGVGENSAVDLSFTLSLLPEVELGSLGQPILGF